MRLKEPATSIYTEIDGCCVQDTWSFTGASGQRRRGRIGLLYGTAAREGRAVILTTTPEHENHDVPLTALLPEPDEEADWQGPPSLARDLECFVLDFVSGQHQES